MAFDYNGNAFAVGSGNSPSTTVRSDTVFYSPLSSGYTKWTPVSPTGMLHCKPYCHDMTDYSAFDQIVSEASVMYVDENLYAHVHEMRTCIFFTSLPYLTLLN